jgi:hypothetical protein
VSTVSVDGITVAYDDEGGGEPLVLVHGHPFDRSMWRPQVEAFSRAGWRVIAPDLRGYGETTVVPGATTMETFARDLAGLLGLVLADTSARAETEYGKRLRHSTADRLLREGMAPYAEEMLPRMVAPPNLRARPELARQVLAMMLATSPEGAAAALRGRAPSAPTISTCWPTSRCPPWSRSVPRTASHRSTRPG